MTATAHPTGTVAFLFTDVEGSTKKWQAHGAAMGAAVARHDQLLRDAIEHHGGYVFKTVGDAFCAAFVTAPDAMLAGLDAQLALAREDWGAVEHIRVRMAVHAGAAEERDADYFGPAVNRAARLLSAGHGGQLLLSLTASELVRDSLPDGCGLLDLGEHRLKDLDRPEHIYQLLSPDLVESFPPLATLDARPNNLPVELTPFIGRDREIEAVKEALLKPATRLVTLLGPGGVGKTRIALQAAAELIESFPHGAFFVVLAQTTDPAVVLAEISEALDVREAGRQSLQQAIIERLKGSSLLLVLDNFEQVLNATPIVSAILKECGGVKIIVTSQIVLRVTGEQEIQIPPLGLPMARGDFVTAEEAHASEAVRLFESRAQAVKGDFVVTDDNAPAVVEICHQLDGLPLAIELAAARVRMLTPQAMLPRLDNRLKLLTGGGRDRPARQQTLREAIAWSHDLLPADQKTLMARLSVFSGGWSFDAAELVALGGPAEADTEEPPEIDVFDGLAELVEHSLVRQDEVETEPRFSMLASIREFGLEQLAAAGEEEVFRGRHARFFRDLAEEANPKLTGSDQASWLRRLDLEHDNCRATLDFALTRQDAESALRTARALNTFWRSRGHLTEGRRWMESALSLPSDDVELRGRALNNLGTLANEMGDLELAQHSYEESLEIWVAVGNRRAEAVVLNNLGQVVATRGELAQSRAIHERSLGMWRELNDRMGIAAACVNLGQVTFREGDLETATTLLAEALKLRRGMGDPVGAAGVSLVMGPVISAQGNHTEAIELLEHSTEVYREAGMRVDLALALTHLGEVHQAAGAIDSAAQAFREALRLWREIGIQRSMECLEGVAAIAEARARPLDAIQLLAAAGALRDSVGEPLPEFATSRITALTDRLRAAVPERDFDEAWQTGRGFALRQAVDLALAESQPVPAYN